jgi:hypothetical protein
MVAGFTTTYAIIAYDHQSCEVVKLKQFEEANDYSDAINRRMTKIQWLKEKMA